MKVSAVIVAGGEGKRMGQNKQFLEVAGVPMVKRTCEVFEDASSVDEIVVAVSPADIERARELFSDGGFKKVKAVVEGGEHRQQSVHAGLNAVSDDSDFVLIHDGARPLLTKEMIAAVVSELKSYDAVVVGVPVTDTIKEIGEGSIVTRTLERNVVWSAQTPQGFKTSLIKEAHERARKNDYRATDDSHLVERLGHKVKMITGSYENIKITTPVDLKVAECILKNRG